jgi:hypothetical protein
MRSDDQQASTEDVSQSAHLTVGYRSVQLTTA